MRLSPFAVAAGLALAVPTLALAQPPGFPASDSEMPATPLPAPGVAQNCRAGIIHTSTLPEDRLCARPLAMTIIEHPRHPHLRT